MKNATELSTASPGEALAWLHESDPARCITNLQKASALRDGGASASSVMPYSVPLYAAPAPGRAPLTDEQIESATGAKRGTPMWLVAVAFTRAIESAHGIAPAGGIGGE
ncbi:hypothetical protein [Variovorax boronicumulans]|uniref:hypothetical protein n=1 Tax=Variovorax boronicumulans TaxID=436515 RepID=UPI0012E6C36C|nr:hypothetical protein [Variovorax boronicumulans]GER21304.1 hypothetical protein VCH24_63510 [Variovorax boronicumulans]